MYSALDWRLLLAAAALAACAGAGEAPAPAGAPAAVVAPAGAGTRRGGPPRDVVELFETKMLPTCSLNGGVCHNANNYPDLRNVAALAELVDLPCGANADADFPDACEPPGDRLVADGGVDVEIAQVVLEGGRTVLVTASDVTGGALAGVRIRRSAFGVDATFDASTAGFVARDARHVEVDLASASAETSRFFTPALPLREDRIHPADVNGDGVRGAALGWREIVPGKPELSYVVARLWDASMNPELMPRQCRAWDDQATRALGCWIEGMKVDASGAVTNLFDPIDYGSCRFEVPSAGRCGSGITIDDIVASECAGCHGGARPSGELDLADGFRAAVVGRPSREVAAMKLVVPGSPDESYLYAKLVGSPTIVGDPMPRGGTLSPAKVEAVRAWIAAGAP